MRIALIGLHFAEYTAQLAIAIARDQGHEVLLILRAENFRDEVGQDDIFKDTRLQVEFVEHIVSPRQVASRAMRLARIIRGFRPDIIHCQEDTKDYLAAALPFFPRARLVLTVHDPVAHSGVDSQARQRTRHGLYAVQLRRRADAILVHGDLMREQAARLFPRLSGRVRSVPHGPLGTFWNPSPDLSWNPGECLLFGRLHHYKGLPVFVDAMHRLRTEGISAHGVIAGRGPALDELRRETADPDLFTIYEQFLSPGDVVERFARANLVVVPYLNGTQSGVAAYALGARRPIVATDVGSIPEMVRHQENGLLVPPGDPAALAAAIGALLSDSERAVRMANAGYSMAFSSLSWSKAAQITVGLYRSLL